MKYINQAINNAKNLRSILVDRKCLVLAKEFDLLVGDALYVYPLEANGLSLRQMYVVEGANVNATFEVVILNDPTFGVDALSLSRLKSHSVNDTVDHSDPEYFSDLMEAAKHIGGQALVEMGVRLNQELSIDDSRNGNDEEELAIEVTKPKGETKSIEVLEFGFVDPVISDLTNDQVEQLNRFARFQTYRDISIGKGAGALVGEAVVDGKVKRFEGHWELHVIQE